MGRKNSGQRERRPKSNLEGAQNISSQLPNILDQHNSNGSNRNSRLLKQTQQQASGDYTSGTPTPVMKIDKPQHQKDKGPPKPSPPLSHPQP